MRKIIGWAMASIGWLIVLIASLSEQIQVGSKEQLMFTCAMVMVMCGVFIAERK